MSESEFTNLVAIAQVTPGPIAVNAATYVGYNTAGFAGALVATFGVALPSFVLVMITYHFVSKFKNSAVVEGAFEGIRPMTAGLLAAAVYFVGGTTFKKPEVIPAAICVLTILLVAKSRISPIWILLGAGAIGALFCR